MRFLGKPVKRKTEKDLYTHDTNIANQIGTHNHEFDIA